MPSNSEKIGVAVVGTGFGQAIHIPGLQHHHRTEVVAVYHRDKTKAKEIAAQFEVPYAEDSLPSLLALPDVDAVTIATPPFLHYDMAKAVLAAQKHLLLEKPLTLKADETKELYHLAQQNQVVGTADFEFRFVPAWQQLAEYLQGGFVGTPRLIKIDWLVASRANPQRGWNWYAQKDKGGGVLGAVGSHAFDYIYWLFGKVERLCASVNCAIKQRPDALENNRLKPVDADDTCLIMMELEGGIPCQLNISSVTYNGRGHWLEIYGDQGTLILGSDNLKDYIHGFRLWGATAGEALRELEISQQLAFPKTFSDGRLAPFVRVVDQWVKGIDQKQSLTPSLKEGFYSQLLMDLTHQSNQEKCWVNVPDLDTLLT
ncbi:MAG: Gfo/Idh/MocA family protein [Microcystaceae cyanobacterium]